MSSPKQLSLTKTSLSAIAIGSLVLAATQSASARPQYVPAWLNQYPNSISLDNVLLGTGQACQLCHETVQGDDSWNGYGWQLKQLVDGGSSITQALAQIEAQDGDSDPTGSDNVTEIHADTQPGWTPGAANTIYFDNGTTLPGQLPPAGILGELDPDVDFVAYYFGDGTGMPCPCSNESGVGLGEGCANGSGSGGLLVGSGSVSVGLDDLEFDASNLLQNQPALLFAGLNAVNGGNGIPFGDGLRCAGQGVVRLGVDVPDSNGDAEWGPGLGVSGGWGAGDTRYFQGWYRDPAGSPCGDGFNLTNGVEVNFVP